MGFHRRSKGPCHLAFSQDQDFGGITQDWKKICAVHYCKEVVESLFPTNLLTRVSFYIVDISFNWIFSPSTKFLTQILPIDSLLVPKSFIGILPHLQMKNGHKGFEYLDASMVCVPWFMPKSHLASI
jgi:hypothetical protein